MAKELIYPLIINYRPTINFLKYSKKIFIYFDVHVVWIDLSYHVKKKMVYTPMIINKLDLSYYRY